MTVNKKNYHLVNVFFGLFFCSIGLSNPISFLKYDKQPIISTGGNNFHRTHAMNPSVIKLNNQYHLYFRGYTDRTQTVQTMGVSRSDAVNFDPKNWSSATKLRLDGVDFSLERKFCDPAAVEFQNSVMLFISMDCNTESKIKVFRSFDGVNFNDLGYVKTTLGYIVGGVPAPVVVNGELHLFTGFGTNIRHYKPSTQNNGTLFQPFIVSFTNNDNNFPLANNWDGGTIITARFFKDQDYVYMIYGGLHHKKDWPEGFGLARTRKDDMSNWERYNYNPILTRGAAGTGDDGALWSGSMIWNNGYFYLIYEGAGNSLESGSSSLVTYHSRNSYIPYPPGYWSSTVTSQLWIAKSTMNGLNLDGVWGKSLTSLQNVTIRQLNNISSCLNEGEYSGNHSRLRTVADDLGCSSWSIKNNNTEFFSIEKYNLDGSATKVIDLLGGVVDRKYSEAQDQNLGDGIPLILYNKLSINNTNQEWGLINLGQGGYYFKNRHSGRMMSYTNLGLVQQMDFSSDQDDSNIKWTITHNAPVSNQKYWIVNRANGKALVINGCSGNPSGNVSLWSLNNCDTQKWSFVKLGDSYKIVSSTNLVLSIRDSTTVFAMNSSQSSDTFKVSLKRDGSIELRLNGNLNKLISAQGDSLGSEVKSINMPQDQSQSKGKWYLIPAE